MMSEPSYFITGSVWKKNSTGEFFQLKETDAGGRFWKSLETKKWFSVMDLTKYELVRIGPVKADIKRGDIVKIPAHPLYGVNIPLGIEYVQLLDYLPEEKSLVTWIGPMNHLGEFTAQIDSQDLDRVEGLTKSELFEKMLDQYKLHSEGE